MGCEQSQERKITPDNTNRWSTNSTSPKKQALQQNGHSFGMAASARETDPVALKRAQESLLEFITTEEKIDGMEKMEPLTMYYIKKSHLSSITLRIEELESRVRHLELRLDGANYFKYKTVKNTMLRLGDKALSKEDHEFLSIVNQLEIAQTELEMAYQEKALVEQQVANLLASLVELKDAYKNQEDLLGKLKITTDTPQEQQIQTDLEGIEEKRIKISEIYERWKEARIQVSESCRHFSTALEKLETSGWDSFNHLERYEAGEDIRDNLVNAVQCLHNAKFYIGLPLPYCSPPELGVLDKAITYLFIDLRSEERRKHAAICYSAVHKRAVALFGWTDKTIELVIEPELRHITRIINEKLSNLKHLRTEELRKRFPTLVNKYAPPNVISRQSSSSIQASTCTLDSETEKIFSELEFDQLSPLPSLHEMSLTARNIEDIVDNHVNAKSKDFNDSNNLLQDTTDIMMENGVTPRRNVSRKLMLLQETIR